ncbi:hypothetical protein C0J52_21413 [Blattella germanica]|nr:hypothetical protein C0J52_21413 [Blattella germanica]
MRTMELLIEQVRLHDILYNTESPNYRDQQKRQEAWEKIGRELQMKAETVKITWDKLRRCFLNAINRRRYKKRSNAARKMVSWKYQHQMGFLLPFVDSRKAKKDMRLLGTKDIKHCDENNKTEENEITDSGIREEASQYSEDIHKEEIIEDKLVDIKRKKLARSDNPIYQIVDVMKENASFRKFTYEKHSTEMDDNDMFFLSMAKMTKTLPPLEQAQIKLQLSNSVLETQIRMISSESYKFSSVNLNSSETTETNP